MSAFLVLCACALASGGDRPVGQNCELTTPPKNAGEEAHHSVLLLVYPRAREIGTNYNGCQVVWIQREKAATLAWIVVIQGGEAVRVWSLDPEMETMLGQCVWEKGVLKQGKSEVCGSSKSMIMKSYLPGCISRVPDGLTESEFEEYGKKSCGDAE
jgi:hypothetical protein